MRIFESRFNIVNYVFFITTKGFKAYQIYKCFNRLVEMQSCFFGDGGIQGNYLLTRESAFCGQKETQYPQPIHLSLYTSAFFLSVFTYRAD